MAEVSVWRSAKVEVRTSPLSGDGVFAREPIAAGEVVAVKAGHVVDTAEMLRLTEEIDDYSLQIHDDLFLSPRSRDEVDDLVVHINHSCDANIGFEGVAYVAMRDIATDEELCHDYALARTADYRMQCRCGTSVCRGTITGDDWKLPEVRARYGQYFMPYILRRMRAERS